MIFSGHGTIVDILVDNGADLDREDQNGVSALHLAVRSGKAQYFGEKEIQHPGNKFDYYSRKE